MAIFKNNFQKLWKKKLNSTLFNNTLMVFTELLSTKSLLDREIDLCESQMDILCRNNANSAFRHVLRSRFTRRIPDPFADSPCFMSFSQLPTYTPRSSCTPGRNPFFIEDCSSRWNFVGSTLPRMTEGFAVPPYDLNARADIRRGFSKRSPPGPSRRNKTGILSVSVFIPFSIIITVAQLFLSNAAP